MSTKAVETNYGDIATGIPFWKQIRKRVARHDTSDHTSRVIDELCQGKELIDNISPGLRTSYNHIYRCMRGLGSEDSQVIERDVLRTAGAVKEGPRLFRDTTELGKAGLARAMHRVLTAVSVTDGMGYCQGMNYAVDFLLKTVSEEDCFCLFLHALRNKHICTLYETRLPILSDFMEVFEAQLEQRKPHLVSLLRERGFLPPFYSIEWFTTLFTLSCPPTLTMAVWDLFFSNVKDIFIRVAVAIMENLEEKLMQMDTEALLKQFRTVACQCSTIEVITTALKMNISTLKLPSGHILEPVDDIHGDILFQLRYHYQEQAQIVHKQRCDQDWSREVDLFETSLLFDSSFYLSSHSRSASFLSTNNTGSQKINPKKAVRIGRWDDELAFRDYSQPFPPSSRSSPPSGSSPVSPRGIVAEAIDTSLFINNSSNQVINNEGNTSEIEGNKELTSVSMKNLVKEPSSTHLRRRKRALSGNLPPEDENEDEDQLSDSEPDAADDCDDDGWNSDKGMGSLGSSIHVQDSSSTEFSFHQTSLIPIITLPPLSPQLLEMKQSTDYDRSTEIHAHVNMNNNNNNNNNNIRSIDINSECLFVRQVEKEEEEQESEDIAGLSVEMSLNLSEKSNSDTERDLEGVGKYSNLYSKIATLRKVVLRCGRISYWPDLCRAWLDCLLSIPSDLIHYNLSDQMLRFCIIRKAHIRTISFFIGVGGADPNSQDGQLYTPLHLAVLHHRADVVRLLLLTGADANIPGAFGMSSKALKLPEDLISNRMFVNYNIGLWPSCLVVLRKKCCLHCNKLFSNISQNSTSTTPSTSISDLRFKVMCSYCKYYVCCNCETKHYCHALFTAYEELYENEIIDDDNNNDNNIKKGDRNQRPSLTISTKSDTSQSSNKFKSTIGHNPSRPTPKEPAKPYYYHNNNNNNNDDIGVGIGLDLDSKTIDVTVPELSRHNSCSEATNPMVPITAHSNKHIPPLKPPLPSSTESFKDDNSVAPVDRDQSFINRYFNKGPSPDTITTSNEITFLSSDISKDVLGAMFSKVSKGNKVGDVHDALEGLQSLLPDRVELERDKDAVDDLPLAIHVESPVRPQDSTLEQPPSLIGMDIQDEKVVQVVAVTLSEVNVKDCLSEESANYEQSMEMHRKDHAVGTVTTEDSSTVIETVTTSPPLSTAVEPKAPESMKTNSSTSTPKTRSVWARFWRTIPQATSSNVAASSATDDTQPMGQRSTDENRSTAAATAESGKAPHGHTGGLSVLSQVLRRGFRPPVWTTARPLSEVHSPGEDAMADSQGVPVYWLGYEGDIKGQNRRLCQLPTWQRFLLPQVFGGEQFLTLEYDHTKYTGIPSKDLDESDSTLSNSGGYVRFVVNDKRAKHSHPTLKTLDQYSDINVTPVRPFPSPRFLGCVDEMRAVYLLLQRDVALSCLFHKKHRRRASTTEEEPIDHIESVESVLPKYDHDKENIDITTNSSMPVRELGESDTNTSTTVTQIGSSGPPQHTIEYFKLDFDDDDDDGENEDAVSAEYGQGGGGFPRDGIWHDVGEDALFGVGALPRFSQRSRYDPSLFSGLIIPMKKKSISSLHGIINGENNAASVGGAFAAGSSPKLASRTIPKEIGNHHDTSSSSSLSLRSWALTDQSSLWVADEDVWCCGICSLQFSIFQRKHHCRRCGGVFCNDHVPSLDISTAVPEYLAETATPTVSHDGRERKQIRLCISCLEEVKDAPNLLESLVLSRSHCSFMFWETILNMDHKKLRKILDQLESDRCNEMMMATTSAGDLKECRSRTSSQDIQLGKYEFAGSWFESISDWLRSGTIYQRNKSRSSSEVQYASEGE